MKNIMNNQLFFGEVFEKLFLGYNFIKLEGGIGLDFLRSEKLIVDFATLFVVLCNGCFVIFFFYPTCSYGSSKESCVFICSLFNYYSNQPYPNNPIKSDKSYIKM